MRLVTKLLLLCAAAMAVAAANEGAPATDAKLDEPHPNWPTQFIPPTASWASVFGANWR